MHNNKKATGDKRAVIHNPEKYETLPVGIVLRKSPGVTRWAKWVWKAVGILPGADRADWKLLRQEGLVSEYHACTLTLELHGAETESYAHGLAAQTPCVYVVMRPGNEDAIPFDVVLITASPYEAQDYCESGEEIIEKIAMTPALMAWVQDFVHKHHKQEAFKKRRRDKKDIHGTVDGVGDARIAQMADVYRAPTRAKKERLQ